MLASAMACAANGACAYAIDVPVLHTQVHGYVMVDAAQYDGRGLGSTDFSLRRADVNFLQHLWGDWLFYADTQLVDWHFELKDVYLRKQTHALGLLTIGNQQEPFGLEQYGSFRNATFLEVATTNALAPSRSVGITSNDSRGPWTWTYGVFSIGPKDEDRVQRGLALTGRVAHVLHVQDGLYHFAINYSVRKVGAPRFNSTSEVALSYNGRHPSALVGRVQYAF
jgi:phosphate-selective porin OprO and OprP